MVVQAVFVGIAFEWVPVLVLAFAVESLSVPVLKKALAVLMTVAVQHFVFVASPEMNKRRRNQQKRNLNDNLHRVMVKRLLTILSLFVDSFVAGLF